MTGSDGVGKPRGRRWWVLGGGVAVVAFCAILVAAWFRPDAASPRDPEADRQAARDLLAAWDTAIEADSPGPESVRPVLINTWLQGQNGEWENDLGANNKLAAEYSAFNASPAVDAAPDPGDGEMRWQDGTSRTVPLIDASTAAAALAESPNKRGVNGCEGCTPVELTDPRLGTTEVDTPFGPAVMPQWSFAVQGSTVRITQLAIDPAAQLAVPSLEFGTVEVDLSNTVSVADDGSLTVSFIGGPPADTGPCGSDYTAELIESAQAVAVLITDIPMSTDRDLACNAAGYGRTVTVTPEEPIGDRVVIDLAGRALARG